MVLFEGKTLIDVTVAAVTITLVEPETPPRVALMLVLPEPVPVTSPLLLAASLTCATALLPEVQLT
jgi:hypothetical protein